MSSVSARLVVLRRLGWLVGLPALAAIVGLAGTVGLPSLERRLKGAANAVATQTEESAEPWLRVVARGRDVVVKGEAPSPELRADALARLQRLPGLRHVVGPLGLVQEASPFVWKATRTAEDRIALSGNRPAEIGPVALAARLAPDLPPATILKDDAVSARGAPPEFPAASAYAVEQLATLTPGGVATLTDTILSFKGEAATIASYDALRLALARPPDGFSLGTVDILPPVIGDFRFAVERRDDGLVLSGNVASESLRATILSKAAEAANGLPVDDRMRTARGLPAAVDPAALSAFSFDVMGLLQAGSVSYADARLSVSGTAIDAQAVGEIETMMKARRPAGTEAGGVSLVTRPLVPYRILVRRDGDSVTLSGHVPDAATRERVLALVRPRFFRERVVDRLRIAQGAPSDLVTAIDAGVAALSVLAQGRVSVTDRALQVTGESLYRETAARLAEGLSRKVPSGWQADAAIAAPDGPVLADPESCRTLFAQAMEGRALRFSAGSAALRADFYPVLDAVAALAKSCPTLRIAVSGHGDPPGAAPDTASPVANLATPAEANKTTSPAPTTSATTPTPAAAATKPASAKAPATKPAAVKPSPAKPSPSKAAEPGKPPPEPDLPRQRALAIVDYLVKAGFAEGAVSASGAIRPAQQGIGLALDA